MTKWYLVGIGAAAVVRVLMDRIGIWPFY